MEERVFNLDSQTVIHVVAQMINILLLFAFAALLVLVPLALLKYLKSKEVRRETAIIRQSLGEALREQRIRCNMTQEFVAEALGVSRQAVSKWENGTSDPSTSNLIALAKLYGVPAEELLRGIGV